VRPEAPEPFLSPSPARVTWTQPAGPPPPPEPARPPPYQVGLATWYGAALAGHRTASGEPFNPGGLTAAHRTLPIGTWVEVLRPASGRAVRVRINDRGPFGDAQRVIDLSRAAADAIGLTKLGVTEVEIRIIAGP